MTLDQLFRLVPTRQQRSPRSVAIGHHQIRQGSVARGQSNAEPVDLASVVEFLGSSQGMDDDTEGISRTISPAPPVTISQRSGARAHEV